jgi:endogenous inhibitor of DNA gyrase (YacG/DUF329 family)
MPKVTACPNCGAPVAWEPGSRWRPFCSQRCQSIDLGAWAADRFVIAGRPEEFDRLAKGEDAA